ncbi:MAG: universal stress protein [Polyangiales bacterium]
MNVERILVPVDYSDHSRRAVEHAVWLGDKLGATVTVVYVAAPPSTYQPLDRWIWGDRADQHTIDDKLREANDEAFESFVSKLPSDARSKISSRMETGAPPSKVILDLLDEEGFDLVVMGTHGHTGAKHVLLGSTTERVIRRAKCPVLTVR